MRWPIWGRYGCCFCEVGMSLAVDAFITPTWGGIRELKGRARLFTKQVPVTPHITENCS